MGTMTTMLASRERRAGAGGTGGSGGASSGGSGGASVAKLWSMPLTGGSATELADLGPGGRDVGRLAYDAGKLWVASYQSNEILVVDEACSTVTVARAAPDTNKVLGIALNATHVFWASFQDNEVWSLPR